MRTPICDFVREYARRDPLRLHMPGHKGAGPLGIEHLDITEIPGADSLYEADGIIRDSEENASALFGCPTFYSTEGSSHCIRAMLYLAKTRRPCASFRLAAARNAHKVFLTACALLDIDIAWLPGQTSLLSAQVDPQALDAFLTAQPADAVYITAPDYLGGMADIAAISAVCRRHNALLLVDNAHGAYLRFLQSSVHPMDLGADICCDSAHKTLGVLTGGAYLHVREEFVPRAKQALALFGSTSPSYLILQSLDAANARLCGSHAIADHAADIAALRSDLRTYGITFYANEPLKLTLCTKPWGYTGIAFSGLLHQKGIECEFADPDHLVLMTSPALSCDALNRLKDALLSIPRKAPLTDCPPALPCPEKVLTPRQAIFAPSRCVPVTQSLGCILAAPSVSCPPAVPIVMCGERIDETAIENFLYYNIKTCQIVDTRDI